MHEQGPVSDSTAGVRSMHCPTKREIVTISGLPGLFLVLWVNREKQRADLLAMRKNPYALPDVPFKRLRAYNEHTGFDID